jgi:hypothetical protein
MFCVLRENFGVSSFSTQSARSRLAAVRQRQLEARSGSSRSQDAGSSLRSAGWSALRTFGNLKRSLVEPGLNDGLEPEAAADEWSHFADAERHCLSQTVRCWCPPICKKCASQPLHFYNSPSVRRSEICGAGFTDMGTPAKPFNAAINVEVDRT